MYATVATLFPAPISIAAPGAIHGNNADASGDDIFSEIDEADKPLRTTSRKAMRKNSKFSLGGDEVKIEEGPNEETEEKGGAGGDDASSLLLLSDGGDASTLQPNKRWKRPTTRGSRKYGALFDNLEGAARKVTFELSGNIEMVAKFVPTILVSHFNEKLKVEGDIIGNMTQYECIVAAMLFIDISGFTPLSARLGARGAVGIEQLSSVLNKYFGEQIALVTEHGGDVIKFAGDALMAMWEENMADTRPLSCLRAAQCAMELQEKLNRYAIHVGTDAEDSVLSIKISLGYGRVTAFHVGGENNRFEFFMAGAPLVQVTLAEHQAQPGDIILSNESWKCVMEQCEGTVLSSGDVKLLAVTHKIPVRQAQPIKLDSRIEAALSSYIPAAILSKMGDFASTWSRGRRESGNTAESWVSDLRTISTIFCCLAVESGGMGVGEADAKQDAELYNELFRTMQRRVYSFEGTIRQFLVDDKGMVLIACYGIVAHDNDAERATRCAMGIADDLEKIGISSSAGVTTGEVFCGLVGGETRCEYALIGDVVNMAARLMASTQDQIRCDIETYARSCKRVVFEHLEPIHVKGKEAKIKVFKPVAGSVSAALSLRKITLTGRNEELAMVSRSVDAFADLGYTSAIIFEGESGMGKSRMIEETTEILFRQKLPVSPNRGTYET